MPKFYIQAISKLVSVAEQAKFSFALSQMPKTGFLALRLKAYHKDTSCKNETHHTKRLKPILDVETMSCCSLHVGYI